MSPQSTQTAPLGATAAVDKGLKVPATGSGELRRAITRARAENLRRGSEQVPPTRASARAGPA